MFVELPTWCWVYVTDDAIDCDSSHYRKVRNYRIYEERSESMLEPPNFGIATNSQSQLNKYQKTQESLRRKNYQHFGN